MTARINVYFNEETRRKFHQIKGYLKASNALGNRQQKNNSATMAVVIDAFHKLFIESETGAGYNERLFQLEKNLKGAGGRSDDLKSIRRQLDQLLYLELTNFHAITKGDEFDVQDLESVHSKIDPKQHELMARIDEVIKDDIARGQTIKHSH